MMNGTKKAQPQRKKTRAWLCVASRIRPIETLQSTLQGHAGLLDQKREPGDPRGRAPSAHFRLTLARVPPTIA